MSMMFEDRKAYAIAERRAVEELGDLDPEAAALEKGVLFDQAASAFTIPFLDEEITVTFPEGRVTGRGGRSLSGAVAVLALHYLVYRGEPLRKEGWMAYREMPGARHFAGAFEKMAEERLAAVFSQHPGRLESAALGMRGSRSKVAEHAFELPACPRVTVLLVLWPADEEGAGSAKLLFPPRAPYYFHSEDLAALAVVLAERLVARDAATTG